MLQVAGFWHSLHMVSSVNPQVLRLVGVGNKSYTALTRNWSWNDVYFHISLHINCSHLVPFPWFPISTAFTNRVSSSCCRISCRTSFLFSRTNTTVHLVVVSMPSPCLPLHVVPTMSLLWSLDSAYSAASFALHLCPDCM